MKDSRGFEAVERPDGPISGALWDHERQLVAAATHATFEGTDAPTMAVLRSYDRALHPWIGYRRPHDLLERIRGWLP